MCPELDSFLKPIWGILTAIMAKNILQIARKEPTPDEIKAQQELAQIVVGVVTELENSTMQAMVEACLQESR